METSAARKLTLVFLLLAVWGCQSMQHSVESVRRSLRSLRSPRAQEGANMDSMQYSREADSDSSDAAVNTGVQNLTVPHFLLHELYLHLEKPIDHTYSDVNSILSFENQANATQCDWMRFGLPRYDSNTRYMKSELKLFHRATEGNMSVQQRSQKFSTYLCYQFKVFCIPFTDNNTVSPSTNGLITYTFNPVPIIRTLRLKVLNIRIRVVGSGQLIPCDNWLLNFVTDDCLGKDKVPLLVTYMKLPETSILSMFLKEAVRNAPIPAPTVPPTQNQLEAQRSPRHKRDTSQATPRATPQATPPATPRATPPATPRATPPATPRATPPATSRATPPVTPRATTPATPTTPTPPCIRKPLPIKAGWALTAKHTFSNTFDIGFCGGHCDNVFVDKVDERASFVNLARRRGYIAPNEYPESCVPHKKENLTVMTVPEEGVYDIILLQNLVVKSCMCVV